MSRDSAFKLRVDVSAEEHERLQASFFAPVTQNVEKSRHLSVYIDTPDGILREQELLWCFSRKDKIRDGRLKAGDWHLERDKGARSFVKKRKLFNKIGGVFTQRIDRETVTHHTGQTDIEIVLERAKLCHGDQSVLMSQVEFTLQNGEGEEFVQFVSQILPQIDLAAIAITPIECGYRLANIGSSEPSDAAVKEEVSNEETLVLSKDIRAFEAFKLIARTEINNALGQLPPTDQHSLAQNLSAVRRVRSALLFFGAVTEAADAGTDRFAKWEAALEKWHDLDVVLTVYLKPAAHRSRLEAAGQLIARIAESKIRASTALAQAWPVARVKQMFLAALETLEAQVSASVAGQEPLGAFIAHELAKAIEHIEARDGAFKGVIKQEDAINPSMQDLQGLKQAIMCFQDAVSFFEPLTKGKSARRHAELQEALGHLKTLLDKHHHLNCGQALVADAAAHVAHLKQTKTHNAQTYAAGALAGFLEALKGEKPYKALQAALADLSEVKPFWTKID